MILLFLLCSLAQAQTISTSSMNQDFTTKKLQIEMNALNSAVLIQNNNVDVLGAISITTLTASGASSFAGITASSLTITGAALFNNTIDVKNGSAPIFNILQNGRVGLGTTAPSFMLSISSAGAGSSTRLQIINPDNTNTASHAILGLQPGGTNGGDASVELNGPAVDWSLGLDNSDADTLKISSSGAVGTNTIVKYTGTGATYTGAHTFASVSPSTTAVNNVAGTLFSNFVPFAMAVWTVSVGVPSLTVNTNYSVGVSSITDYGVGDFGISFDVATVSTNYIAVGGTSCNNTPSMSLVATTKQEARINTSNGSTNGDCGTNWAIFYGGS